MSLERREVLGAMAVVAALAGCVGADDDQPSAAGGSGDGAGEETDGGGPTDETTTSASGDEPTAGAENPTVRVDSHPEHGDILVDSDGRTLYMFDQDARGEAASTCYDSCADAWPPLTVSESPTAGGSVTAALDTFARESGDEQVTADGWPLYYYASDGDAGDASGQGANDVWWVLAPDGTPRRTAESTAATAEPTTTTSAGAGPY